MGLDNSTTYGLDDILVQSVSNLVVVVDCGSTIKAILPPLAIDLVVSGSTKPLYNEIEIGHG